jgi:hypothetical protein
MKTTLCLPFVALLLTVPLTAAPLMETTAIQAQPNATAPVIGYLKAGTEPAPAAVMAPAGWMAVELPGPHEAYVHNNDFSKNLDVHPGAAIRLQPRADAPALATMQEGDKTEITGLRSGWTQIKLHRTITGYIKVGGTAPAPVVPGPAAAVALPPPAPALTPASPLAVSGPAAPRAQMFQGTLVKSARILFVAPRRDFAYQLNNAEGTRIAFLDLSRALATEKVEPIVGRPVKVSGVLRQTENGRHLVIEVVSIEVP